MLQLGLTEAVNNEGTTNALARGDGVEALLCALMQAAKQRKEEDGQKNGGKDDDDQMKTE